MSDYYKVLDVDRNADASTIKSAYRKLAKKYHPDSNQGNESATKKFKEISEAYDVLKDDQKRAAYDRYGSAAFNQGGFGSRNAQGGGFQEGGFSDFADVFSDIFGNFGGRDKRAKADISAKGNDLRYDISISLHDAFFGIKKTIHYTSGVSCDSCSGTGSADTKSLYINCIACRGSGSTRVQQGFFMMETTCKTCKGSGKAIKNPCKSCYGNGRVERKRELTATIPQGIEDGSRIRIAGEGEAGLRGGPSGDLYIFVSVQEHQLFKRSGSDLYCELPIKMTTAALGGNIEIGCIDGSVVKVEIPKGTQSETKFRVSSKGMPILRSKKFGDLYAKVQVEIPVKLSEKQKKLLQEFEEDSEIGCSPKTENFFSKVRNLWQKK